MTTEVGAETELNPGADGPAQDGVHNPALLPPDTPQTPANNVDRSGVNENSRRPVEVSIQLHFTENLSLLLPYLFSKYLYFSEYNSSGAIFSVKLCAVPLLFLKTILLSFALSVGCVYTV